MTTNRLVRRRRFLAQTATTGTLALLGLSPHVQAKEMKPKENGRRRRPATVLDLRVEHFEQLVGQQFDVSDPSNNVRLKLLQVRGRDHYSDTHRPLHVRQEPFSLLFVASGQEKLNSGIHAFEHPEVGDFHLFLHEVGAGENMKEIHYEVVFN